MRIAICDDCREDARQLKALLEGQDVRTYSCANELLKDVEAGQMHFDLYLLDIYMEDSMNGIELARELDRLDAQAALCFVSTSNDFYREAYDLYAVQYLIKPVQEKDIARLLEKVSHSLVWDKEQSLSFRWQGELGSIPYSRILYISSRKHTLYIHCKDGKVQKCIGKLNELAFRLDESVFSRCHQSFLVNMYQVDSLCGAELTVFGKQIPVSRRYYAEVKRRYQEILFEEVE